MEREFFEKIYGKENVWNTEELQEKFEVIGFLAPVVVVIRKSDKVKGACLFQHSPRIYYAFQEA